MARFDPVAWQPLPAPSLESNHRLTTAELWDVGAAGPEDVVIAADGSAIVGTEDGTILRVTGSTIEQVADVGGRPLGIEWHGDDIVVCNAFRGLQLVSMNGSVKSLVETHAGERLLLTNNASVASDGTIYFSDSSTRWDLDEYIADLLEGRPTGRVFRYRSGSVDVVAEGLQFANGVALDTEGHSLFIAETGRYRIHRHWLQGEMAGTTELFVDNMPGYPDNLSFDGELLWVGCASPRQAVPDFISPRPWMRSLAHRLPEAIKPKAVRHGMVFAYDLDGHVIHDLQDPTGTIAITTSARRHDGRLYVGQLHDPAIAVLPL